MWILRSDVALSHETNPRAELIILLAAEEHNPTNRMKRLRDEVFKELKLERQHPFYFARLKRLMSSSVLGVAFHQTQTIIIDVSPFKDPKITDRAIKLTIAHEIVHAYGREGHNSTMISMDQLISNGDIYKYKISFSILDRLIMELLGVDKCPASLMFPHGGYDKVCGPLMYEIYMNEAREAVKGKK